MQLSFSLILATNKAKGLTSLKQEERTLRRETSSEILRSISAALLSQPAENVRNRKRGTHLEHLDPHLDRKRRRAKAFRVFEAMEARTRLRKRWKPTRGRVKRSCIDDCEVGGGEWELGARGVGEGEDAPIPAMVVPCPPVSRSRISEEVEEEEKQPYRSIWSRCARRYPHQS